MVEWLKVYNYLLNLKRGHQVQKQIDFYESLHQNPTDSFLSSVEYTLYQKEFAIHAYETEKPICVVVPGLDSETYDIEQKNVISSIARQNYTNYTVLKQ